MKLQSSIKELILSTPRYHKRAILIFIDLFLVCFALWTLLSIRLGELYIPPSQIAWALVISAPLAVGVTLWWFDVYKRVTRYVGYRGAIDLVMAIGLATLIWALAVLMAGQGGVPRSIILPFGVVTAILLILVRVAIKLLLESADIRLMRPQRETPLKRTIIYGAGQMGIRLLADIRKVGDRDVVGFVDPSSTLWRQYVNGVKVHEPTRLARLIERHEIAEVLVALPGSQLRERRDVLKQLESLDVSVKILPAYEDISSGQVGVGNLRDVEVGDLLGRDPVKPNAALLARAIRGKSVLITGAGGSIGSELVRRVASQAPRLIVLLDVSELALYTIENELTKLISQFPADTRPRVKAVLGSVLDRQLVTDVIVENGIKTVYHAAAYKHVPIVESNAIVSLRNNVFGTQIVAEVASNCGVERFVLISTDKAVRPPNIMGASKRLAELILQAESSKQSDTIFTVVRFGNVLDSSGSVVPKFREQIRSGGPITVTHPEVTRYFMSIPEAAELVVQAGSMATGGEVFILQMGDPVRIDHLARLMVQLSNLEVRDADNPDGDIEIRYIGLRPGEKLYEELLIGAQASSTEHPRIFKSDEPFLLPEKLGQELSEIQRAMQERDIETIQSVLERTVEGYRRSDSLAATREQAPTAQPSANIPRTLH